MNSYPPTRKALREYLERHEVTSEDAGELVGVTSRVVRYWCTESSNRKNQRQIPYSAWYTLRCKVEGSMPK